MTFSEIKNALFGAGIESYDTDARILIESFCHRTPILPDEEFSGASLAEAVKRRQNREPLQYIIGKWGFYNEEYFVSPDCLIPRADTEILVEHLVKNLPHGARFLDLCTGSGCIAISVAKNRADTSALAADISESALKTAQKNAAHNGVNTVEFAHIDVTKRSPLDGKFDCIVSNPPYIRTAVMEELAPELACEPRIALDGGSDGMRFYRAIVENFGENLTSNGFFAFEFGFDQKDDARALADAHGFSFTAINDYGGNFRVAIFGK